MLISNNSKKSAFLFIFILSIKFFVLVSMELNKKEKLNFHEFKRIIIKYTREDRVRLQHEKHESWRIKA